MRVEAVTLDAAGTVLAVAEPVGITYARVARVHGLAATPGDVERRFRAALATAPPLAFPGATPGAVADRERTWWRAIVARALDGDPATPGMAGAFDELFAHYARADAWRVFPEVRGVLATLRARGLRLGIVSNFDGRLPALLAALGLDGSVDTVVHSAAAGSAKPNRGIFEVALARVGIAPSAAVHIGDEVDADVRGALGAGLHAMLLDRHGRTPPLPTGVRALRTLAELPGALDDA